MARHKVALKQKHIVIRSFWDEFDTSDQIKWDSLLKKAEGLDEEEFAALPKDAPADLNLWMKLYKNISEYEYEHEEEEDWLTIRKFGPEEIWTLKDSEGNIVLEEEG